MKLAQLLINNSGVISVLNTGKQVEVPFNSETKCSFCTGTKCCVYITQKIEAPRSKYDFEHLLWQISHENIRIYKESDGWYMMIRSRCTHLGEQGQCNIYDARPQICRDYSNDYCEYDEPVEKNFALYFDGYDALLKYCKRRFKRWGK